MIIKKKVYTNIKLQIKAGMANPTPPVGPALGQQGVNIMEFCKAFNKATEKIEYGLPVPVVITVYSDRSFTFITKSPPASILLKKAAGIELGISSKKKEQKVKNSKVTYNQIREIAKIKSVDMTGSNIDAMSKSIIGTARSMGLFVEK